MTKQQQTVYVPCDKENALSEVVENRLTNFPDHEAYVNEQSAYLYSPEEHARVTQIMLMLEKAIGKPDEIIKKMEDGATWEAGDGRKGGQMCGIPRGVTLTQDELGVKFYVNMKRTQIENRQIALHLLRIAIQYL